MMNLVRCDNCNKSGLFVVELSLEIGRKTCDCCHHTDKRIWTYTFCNIDCLSAWMLDKQVNRWGVDCRDCRRIGGESTGFYGGFESNGVCKTCDGKKKVEV